MFTASLTVLRPVRLAEEYSGPSLANLQDPKTFGTCQHIVLFKHAIN